MKFVIFVGNENNPNEKTHRELLRKAVREYVPSVDRLKDNQSHVDYINSINNCRC